MSTAAPEAAAQGVRWDLSALFASENDPKISQTWDSVNKRADSFQAYRGKIESGSLSAEELAAAIVEWEEISNEMNKPVLYANLLFEADTSRAELGAFLQAQFENASEVRVKLMFFDLELQGADDGYIESVRSDPALAEYGHFLDVTRAFRPYKLDETREVLLEETANTGCRAWQRLHSELTSNQKFRSPDGSKEPVSLQEVLEKLRDADRQVRISAADSLSDGLKQLERPLVFTFNTLLADKRLEDRLRGFESPESSRHLANELDKGTVDMVMDLCREQSGIVARYYAAKRKVLGLSELTHVDRYAPLHESRKKVDWGTAKSIVLDSFGSFSGEMADIAQKFFDSNWIDAEPRPGKGGGAFCSPNTPDTHPVLFQSYLGTMNDVMTLAHEMGHGAHAFLSRGQRPVNYNGTLPLAELASIFSELITFERLVAEADHDDKVALYGQKAEDTFATVQRQAAMFRFERRCHEKRRSEGELSAEDFGDIWQEEMQSMFGDGLKLGDQHRAWWQYVGHFVSVPFYVYAYSFGELLTLGVYQRFKESGPSFVEAYVDVLRRGGSETPKELMGRLGIDLQDKSFWQGGFDTICGYVGEFERLAGA